MSQSLVTWMEVLDRIEQSLEQSLARAVDPPAPLPASEEDALPFLERLDERLQQWKTCLEKVEAEAATAEELLAAELSAFEECRRRLTLTSESLNRWLAER